MTRLTALQNHHRFAIHQSGVGVQKSGSPGVRCEAVSEFSECNLGQRCVASPFQTVKTCKNGCQDVVLKGLESHLWMRDPLGLDPSGPDWYETDQQIDLH